MTDTSTRQRLAAHVKKLMRCRKCPKMHPPVVSGRAVVSRIVLVGQAPGDKEPKLGRPFAWTAGKRLFKWLFDVTGWPEMTCREEIYFAAVCRCFPGKKAAGGDRVPSPEEVANCAEWLNKELEILKPALLIPVGKLAIEQFVTVERLDDVVGKKFQVKRAGQAFDVIPLPHPSGASPWCYTATGKRLLKKALRLIARHGVVVK